MSRKIILLPFVSLLCLFLAMESGLHDVESSARDRLTQISAASSTAGATLTVLNTNDSGVGSLRQALLDASSGDTILIAPSLHGQTLTLESNLPAIDKTLTVDGTEAPLFKIDGNNQYRSGFEVTQNGDVTIIGLTFINGNVKFVSGHSGGAFNLSRGVLTVRNSTIVSNLAEYGGAFSNASGALTIVNSTLHNNRAEPTNSADGGGALTQFQIDIGEPLPVTEIQYATITDNSSTILGRDGLHVVEGTLTLTASLLFHVNGSCNIEVGATLNSGGYNVDNDAIDGDTNPCGLENTGDLTDTNPFLDPLEDNGGGTETRSFPDGFAPGQDHIPTGEAGCGTTVRYDQTGGIRAFDFCDSGAFELEGCIVKIPAGAVYQNADSEALRTAYTAVGSGDTLWVIGRCIQSSSDDLIELDRDITIQGATLRYINGAYSFDTSPLLDERPFLDAMSSGRVISVAAGTTRLNDLILMRGQPDSGSSFDGNGGGLLVSPSATAHISRSTVRNHSVTFLGAGIFNAGTLTVTQTTISGNQANSFGGGILTQGTSFITQSTFHDNSAVEGGGLYISSSESSGIADNIISNSTFSHNLSADRGGAVIVDGSATFTNNTFFGNSSDAGGGISYHIENSPPTIALQNNLFAANTNGDCLRENGSILVQSVNNVAQSTGGAACDLDTSALGNNLLGVVNVNLDPHLQANGGPTPTHALLAGSPALDHGASSLCPTHDQRGIQRLFGCDAGAFQIAADQLFVPIIVR